MHRYDYSPLPTPTSIRVIRFPQRGNDGLLHSSFKTIDLNEKPLYHALSYTWGNPHADGPKFEAHYTSQDARYREQETIMIDGKPVSINRNLHDALSSMKEDTWRRYCNSRTKRMRSQLHLAVLLRRVDDVRALLASKVDLDEVDDVHGCTPLAFAAGSGSVEMVNMLLNAGADVGVAGPEGRTAIDHARRNGNNDIADLLESAESASLRREKYESQSVVDGSEKWIWIDQLCINQADSEERGKQVSMMGEIYQSSFWTLVWLGNEDVYTRTAVQTIEKLAGAEGDIMKSSVIPYDEDQSEEVYKASNIPYVSHDEWKALAALFQRQYFKRVWVVQENIFSRAKLGLCGEVEIPWRHFFTIAQQLYFRQVLLQNRSSAKYINSGDAALEIEYHASQLVQWEDRWVNGDQAANPKSFGLGALVGDMWTFRATDSRDKIFGFYGLLNLYREKQGKGNYWQADYTKPAAQVFAEAVKVIIEENGNLGILSNVLDVSRKKTLDLPSWAPDFAVHYTTALRHRGHAAGSRKEDQHGLPRLKDAPWTHLPVYARQFDSIIQFGTTTSGPGDLALHYSPSWFSLVLLLPTPYHSTGLSRTEVLWRTLTSDTSISGSERIPESFGRAFRDLISMMVGYTSWVEGRRFVQAPYDPENPPRLPESPSPNLGEALQHVRNTWENPVLKNLKGEALKKQFGDLEGNMSDEWYQDKLVFDLMKLHVLALTEMEKGEGEDGKERLFTPTLEEIEKYNEALHWEDFEKVGKMRFPEHPDMYVLPNSLGKRRLFVTERRFLGLGPAGMREGDRVSLVRGLRSVAVLRKGEEEGEWGFVGEAFVFGVMDGEEAGKEGWEWIRLV